MEMADSDRPKEQRQIANDQNTVSHLRELLTRNDFMTVSHLKQPLDEQMTVNHLQKQMTVSHLVKPVGATPPNNPPAQPPQPAPTPVSPSGTGGGKK